MVWLEIEATTGKLYKMQENTEWSQPNWLRGILHFVSVDSFETVAYFASGSAFVCKEILADSTLCLGTCNIFQKEPVLWIARS
jgi:hypothetical protein